MGYAENPASACHALFFQSPAELFYHELIRQKALYEDNLALFQLMNGLHDAPTILAYKPALKALLAAREQIDAGFNELKSSAPSYYNKLKEKSQTLAREYSITDAHSVMLLEILCNGPLYSEDDFAPLIIYKLLWNSALENKEAITKKLPKEEISSEKRASYGEKKPLDYLMAAFFRKGPVLKKVQAPLLNWSAITLDAIFRLDLQKNHYLMQDLLKVRKHFEREFTIIDRVFTQEMERSNQNPILQFQDNNIQLLLYLFQGAPEAKGKISPYLLFLIRSFLMSSLEKTLTGSKEAKELIKKQMEPLLRSGIIS